MTPEAFDKLTTELAQRIALEHPGHSIFVAVFPPGAFSGGAGPLTASTLPLELQPPALRSLADGIEGNSASLIFAKYAVHGRIGEKPDQ